MTASASSWIQRLCGQCTTGTCLSPQNNDNYNTANQHEAFLDLVRHFVNMNQATHVSIDPSDAHDSYMDFKIFVYPHETIIYARGKRMAYVNFPLNIVLSYIRTRSVSVSIHATLGANSLKMQSSLEQVTPPSFDVHFSV